MSFVDKIHYCWEQCCDLGPHACVCGNDCESDEGSGGRVMVMGFTSLGLVSMNDEEECRTCFLCDGSGYNEDAGEICFGCGGSGCPKHYGGSP